MRAYQSESEPFRIRKEKKGKGRGYGVSEMEGIEARSASLQKLDKPKGLNFLKDKEGAHAYHCKDEE